MPFIFAVFMVRIIRGCFMKNFLCVKQIVKHYAPIVQWTEQFRPKE